GPSPRPGAVGRADPDPRLTRPDREPLPGAAGPETPRAADRRRTTDPPDMTDPHHTTARMQPMPTFSSMRRAANAHRSSSGAKIRRAALTLRDPSRPFVLCMAAVLLACRAFADDRGATAPPERPHIRALLENAMHYLSPANKMIDPVSGYPFEGWNQDPKRGL